MKPGHDLLGDRMKTQYEKATQYVLPRRTYTILRLDGRTFHDFTRNMERPFDSDFAYEMNRLAERLCLEVAGSVFAYTQSDEISILMQDFESTGTQPWFGGNVQKIVSVAAGFAAANFGPKPFRPNFTAHFDARVFTIPDPVEVANYFIWRQKDAIRNSVSMAAQAHFPHKELQGVGTAQLKAKLLDAGVHWAAYDEGFRHGRTTARETYLYRSAWRTRPAEVFSCDPGGFLARSIPPLPVLQAVSTDE